MFKWQVITKPKTLAPRYSSKVFGHDIENLIKEFGSPLFIISEEKFVKMLEIFKGLSKIFIQILFIVGPTKQII